MLDAVERAADASRGCAPRTPATSAGRSSTGPSRPTTRWASTTPGAAPTRTSSSASTPCSATTSAGRTASTARACGSRSTSSASWASPASATSRPTASPTSCSLCKQRVLTYAARPDRAVHPPGHVDGLERPRRAAPAARPAGGRTRRRSITVEGPHGPVTDTVEMIVGPPGHARAGRLVLHLHQREQRPHLGLPGRVPPARLAVQGPRLDALVRALRHGHQPDGDERGLPGPRGPGLDGALPARRPARRVPAGLDHDALDADAPTWPPPWARSSTTSRCARATTATGSARAPSRRRSGARSRCSRSARAPTWWAGATAARSTTWPRSATRLRGRPGRAGARLRAPRHRLGRGRRGRGHGHRPHRARLRRRGLPAGQGSSACRSSRRSTRTATTSTASAGYRPGRARPSRRAIVEDLEATRLLLPPGAVHAPLPALLALRHAAALPRRGRVVHLDGRRSTTSRASELTAEEKATQPALPDHGRRRPHPLDPGLRLRARARLAAHDGRLDDLQEALLGPGAAHLGVHELRRTSRSSAAATSCEQRAVEGWEEFEGHTPHRPYVDAVKIACRACGARRERIRDVGNPWLDAGIVPFSHAALPRRTRTTGRSGSRPTSSPSRSRASSATGSTRCWP